jgi:Membrane protease subunits, stomatin/prohibitin homologs
MGPLVVLIILILIAAVVVITNLKIVPQAYSYVLERLGTYAGTWGTGLHFKIPFIDTISRKVSLKEQVIDFPPQPVITKDNVTMQIDTVVYFEITDPKLYTYGVERPLSAIENLTATTLRNIIGDMELDNTLTSRDIINSKIRVILDEATDPWGIKVNRVELKNILPPREIQDAMEKQMKAERERRARILDAEGEKRSAILVAEGHKESAILRADASKETKIREAQGEAEAIIAVQKALADSLRVLNEAAPSDAVIKLKSLEAFAAAANGKATKLIIPSEIQGLVGLASSLKETVSGDAEK